MKTCSLLVPVLVEVETEVVDDVVVVVEVEVVENVVVDDAVKIKLLETTEYPL